MVAAKNGRPDTTRNRPGAGQHVMAVIAAGACIGVAVIAVALSLLF